MKRTYFNTAISNFKIPSLKIKFNLSTPLIAGGLMAALIGPQIIRPRLIGGIAKLSQAHMKFKVLQEVLIVIRYVF